MDGPVVEVVEPEKLENTVENLDKSPDNAPENSENPPKKNGRPKGSKDSSKRVVTHRPRKKIEIVEEPNVATRLIESLLPLGLPFFFTGFSDCSRVLSGDLSRFSTGFSSFSGSTTSTTGSSIYYRLDKSAAEGWRPQELSTSISKHS